MMYQVGIVFHMAHDQCPPNGHADSPHALERKSEGSI